MVANEITHLISGNRGGWFPARKDQIDAYEAFTLDSTLSGVFRFNLFNGGYYNLRENSNGQSNRWTEIQDRTGDKKWRRILDLTHIFGIAPNPI